MSQEIIYTSAPHGLKPGSRGFCTVQSTPGMAKSLAERLESLSGYRHAYPPHDPRASTNPVNYSHLLMTVGGQLYHVLSRICDAGLDYSKRSNKLAHHVALEPPEIMQAVGGPAWVLADASFCVKAWDGNVGHLSAGRLPKPGDRRPQRCDYWAKLVGDPGWAGVLAETGLDDRGRPMPVIFKPGTDALPLVVEAMSLLPPERRWKVTFSTYFTKLPAGVDCRWRFLLDGTPEAKLARRDPHTVVIDLCKPLGKATGGPLVESARTGKVVRPARPKPALPKAGAVIAPTPATPMPAAPVEPPSGVYDTRSTAPAHSGLQKVALADRLSRSKASYDVLRPRRQFSQHLKTVGYVACLVLLLVVVFLLGGQFFSNRLRQQEHVASGSGNERNAEQGTPERQGIQRATREPRQPQSRADASRKEGGPPEIDTRPATNPNLEAARKQPNERAAREDNADTEAGVTNDDPDADGQPAQPDEEPPPTPEPQPPKRKDPFEDIKKHKRVLPLPELNRAGGGSSDPQELAKLFVPAGADCQLSILGSDKLLGAGRSFEIIPKGAGGTPRWNVVQKVQNVSVTQDIGSFALTDDSLTFQWASGTRPGDRSAKLQYCVLEICVGETSERCTLTKPKEVESAKIIPFASPPRADLDLAPDTVPNLELLRIELQPHGFPKHKIEPRTGIMVGETSTITFLDGSSLQLVLKFEFDKQSQALSFDTFLNIDDPIAEHEKRGRQRLTRGILENHRKVWTEDRFVGLKGQFDKMQATIQEIDDTAAKHRTEQAKLREQIERRRPGAGAPERTRKEYEEWLRQTNDYIAQQQADDAIRHGQARRLEKEELGPLRKAFEEVRQQRAWRQAVEKLVDELANNGDLEYRVYVEIAGQKVGLIQSKGFSQD